MNQRRKIYWCGWILLASPMTSALALDEQALVQRIRENHPLSQMAAQDQEAAQGEYRAARGGFDPVLKFQVWDQDSAAYPYRSYDLSVEQPTQIWGARAIAGYRRGVGDFPVYDSKLETNSGGELRAGVELPLLRNGAIDERRARQSTADAQLNAVAASREQQVLDAIRVGLHRYWDWIAALERKRLTEALLKIAMQREHFLKTRVKLGDLSQIEQVDNDRIVAQRRGALVSAERAVERAELELSLYNWVTRDQKSLPDSRDVRSMELLAQAEQRIQAVESNFQVSAPELRALRYQLDAREVETRFARNQVLPKLDLGAYLARDRGMGNAKWNSNEWRLGIQLEFPLWFNTGLGRRQTAYARQLKSEVALRWADERWNNLRNDSTQAMAASLSRLRLAKNELELAVRIEQAELTRFKHGDSSLLFVNQREQATLEAGFKVVDLELELLKIDVDQRWMKAVL